MHAGHERRPVAASDRACIRSRGGGGGRLRTGRGKHHAREQGRSALDQGVRSLDQGRDRSLRLSVREALTGPGADFMSTSPVGANKSIEDIEVSLLAATKSALGASQSHMGRVTCAVPLTLTADNGQQKSVRPGGDARTSQL